MTSAQRFPHFRPSCALLEDEHIYIYFFFLRWKDRFFLRFTRFRGIVKERGGNLRRSRIVDSVSIAARVYSFSRRKSKIMGGWKEQWVSEEVSESVLLQTFLLFLYFRGYKKIYIAIEINRRCKGNIGFTEKRFSCNDIIKITVIETDGNDEIWSWFNEKFFIIIITIKFNELIIDYYIIIEFSEYMKRKKFQNRSMVMNDISKKIMDIHFNLYLIYTIEQISL